MVFVKEYLGWTLKIFYLFIYIWVDLFLKNFSLEETATALKKPESFVR